MVDVSDEKASAGVGISLCHRHAIPLPRPHPIHERASPHGPIDSIGSAFLEGALHPLVASILLLQLWPSLRCTTKFFLVAERAVSGFFGHPWLVKALGEDGRRSLRRPCLLILHYFICFAMCLLRFNPLFPSCKQVVEV
ncbi:hypothetical protein GW17_00045395 [Ensete ventricosum]|nr:hypothetical protein GW17_00045395 [Ensete ventricosum]